jgi:hypothetical protein
MHETLFRVGIAGDMLYCVGVVVLLTALYVILKPVNQNLALLAAFGRLVHGLTWLLATLNLFTALRLLRDAEYSRAFGSDQLAALTRLYLSGFDAYYVGLLFWGSGATVGSYLWFKSTQGAGCLRGDLQCMVCCLHVRLLHLPGLRQSREPVVVRLAHGYL